MAGGQIDTCVMEDEINGFKKQSDKWAIEVLKSVQAYEENHIDIMRNANDLKKEFEKRKERATVAISESFKGLDAEREEMEREASHFKQLELTEKEERHEIMRMKDDLELQRKEIDLEMAELKDIERVKRSKEQALLVGSHTYRKFIGVRFEVPSTKENLAIIFTNIDPHAHNREFSFVLRVTESYTVVECKPPLKGMKSLVEEVNRTNDFALFIRKVRRLFLSLALEEASAAGIRQGKRIQTLGLPPEGHSLRF